MKLQIPPCLAEFKLLSWKGTTHLSINYYNWTRQSERDDSWELSVRISTSLRTEGYRSLLGLC